MDNFEMFKFVELQILVNGGRLAQLSDVPGKSRNNLYYFFIFFLKYFLILLVDQV